MDVFGYSLGSQKAAADNFRVFSVFRGRLGLLTSSNDPRVFAPYLQPFSPKHKLA